jgi:hypothetical protein
LDSTIGQPSVRGFAQIRRRSLAAPDYWVGAHQHSDRQSTIALLRARCVGHVAAAIEA